MKKILFGLVLGFFIHKGFQTIYSYAWWSAEQSKECRQINPPFDCINNKLGIINYIGLSTTTFHYTWGKWELRH